MSDEDVRCSERAYPNIWHETRKYYTDPAFAGWIEPWLCTRPVLQSIASGELNRQCS